MTSYEQNELNDEYFARHDYLQEMYGASADCGDDGPDEVFFGPETEEMTRLIDEDRAYQAAREAAAAKVSAEQADWPF